MFLLNSWRRNFTKFHRVFDHGCSYAVVNDTTVYRYSSPANEDYANCGLHVKLWSLWLMAFCFLIKVDYFLSSIFASVQL